MLLIYEYISLFWYYIKQTMNVYSCNGKNIFIRWKMECSIQLGCRLVKWNIPSFFGSWKYSYHCTNKHWSLYLHNIVQFYIVKLCEIIVRTIFAGISILLLSKSFSSYISKCLLQQLLPGGIYCIYLKPRDYKSANHVWCSPYLYNNHY
jgi:hypothetical protein